MKKPLDPATCPHCDSMSTAFTGEQPIEKRDVFHCNFCLEVFYTPWPEGYEPKWRHVGT